MEENNNNFAGMDDIDDRFLNFLNGAHIIDDRESRHEKVRKILDEQKDSLSENDKTKLYSEIGLNKHGKLKGRTCWKYVKNCTCHHTNSICNEGHNIGGFWHPDPEEREYLFQAKKKFK